MRAYFDWLVRHERLVACVSLILMIALVVQVKLGNRRVTSDVITPQSRALARPSEMPLDSIVNVAGTWDMRVLKRRGGTQNWTLMLEQNGTRLSGTINSEGGDLPVNGTIEGRNISLSAERFGVTVEFPATFNGDTMTGTMRVLTVNRQWTATRRS